ncbi:MAG: SUMF1/EgtB/PvdO family nonheme iron enzyme [Armatimonadota bacterium]
MSRSFSMISTVWLSVLVLLALVSSAYAAAPTISSFSPTSGQVGDEVIITGTNFTSVMAVTFNGTSANFIVQSSSSLSANVPYGATTGKLTIYTNDGSSSSADDFTVWVPSSLSITLDPGYGYNAEFARISLDYSLMGREQYNGSVSFNKSGKGTIYQIKPGSYTFILDGSHWLRRTIFDLDLRDSKSLAISLANGDADGDNQVNLFDFVVLDLNFGSAKSMADLDGDGLVNLFDYVIIDSFFDSLGDGDGTTKINPIDGAEMVWVFTGEFPMGSDTGYADQKPQRTVYLDGYWMYKYEVTVAQYRTFCQSTGRSMPTAPNGGWQETHPIVNVSWQDAATYASWAGVSLPTEAQWEKAARSSIGRVYPWGNLWDASKCANYNNSPSGTKPVGNYPSDVSPYGCMDMAGNAIEWCSDWYNSSYYQTAPFNNPPGPSSGSYRVVRGGSCYNSSESAFRCAYRNYSSPSSSESGKGFRCAKVE